MKLGFAGPVSLKLLSGHVRGGEGLPEGYRFPPMATLIEEYLRRGHRVSVFTLDPTTPLPRTFQGDRLTIHVGRFRTRARHRAMDFFAAERADLVSAMREEPCDIVHAHWTYEFALAAIASGSPYVVTAHDAPLRVLRFLPDAYRGYRFLMALWVARRARYLTAVSPYVAEHYRRVLRYRRPIKVVPNGLPDGLFAIGDKRSKVSNEGLVFATVLTGWGKLKNGRVALQAFDKVRKAIPEARLLMFGLGHGRGEEGAVWARRNGLSRDVEFVGAIQHPILLKRLASEVDVLVHPSLEEAHPLSVSEAMALSIPVIGGARSGGVPFTLEDGKAGLLADVRSPADVARAMLRLGREDGLRLDLGRAARESACRRFRVARVVDAYEELYEEVLADWPSGKHGLVR